MDIVLILKISYQYLIGILGDADISQENLNICPPTENRLDLGC